MKTDSNNLPSLLSWQKRELLITSRYFITILCTQNWSSSTYFPNLLLVLSEKEFPSMPCFQASSWQRLPVWPIFSSFFPLRSGSALSASDYSHMQYTKHSYKGVLPSFPRASPCHHHFCHMPKPFGTQPYFGTNCDSVPMPSRVKFVTWNLERKMRGIMKWIITQLSWNHQILFLLHVVVSGVVHRMLFWQC